MAQPGTAPARTGAQPGTGAQQEPDPRRWWSLAVIAMAQLMIVLDASVVIVALPSAQRSCTSHWPTGNG